MPEERLEATFRTALGFGLLVLLAPDLLVQLLTVVERSQAVVVDVLEVTGEPIYVSRMRKKSAIGLAG